MSVQLSRKRSVAATTSLSLDLNERVEALIKARGYSSKSEFIKDATRHFVLLCEQQPLAGLPRVEAIQTQN